MDTKQINGNYYTLSPYTRGRYLSMEEDERERHNIPKDFPFDTTDITMTFQFIQGLLNHYENGEWCYRTSSKTWNDIVKEHLDTRKYMYYHEERTPEFRGKKYKTQYIIKFPNIDTNILKDAITKQMDWELEQYPIVHNV